MTAREKRQNELNNLMQTNRDQVVMIYMQKCQPGGIGQSPPTGMLLSTMIDKILEVEFGPAIP